MKFRAIARTGSSPASASTRAPATPAPTSARCGPPPAPDSAPSTFTSETATGWQQATFAAPIAVTANTTYVASYHAPDGRYAANSAGLRQRRDHPRPADRARQRHRRRQRRLPVRRQRVPRPAASTATNYWVDVVFDTTAIDTHGPDRHRPSRRPPARPVCPSSGAVRPPSPSPSPAPVVSMRAPDLRATAVPATVVVRRRHPDRDVDPVAPTWPTRRPTRRPSAAPRTPPGNTMAPVTWSFTTPRATAAAARPGTRRPDRRRDQQRQPVLHVPRRDPAHRGSQRVRRPSTSRSLTADHAGAVRRRRARRRGGHRRRRSPTSPPG